ncbi:MAG: hypothetical protein WBD95_04870 [Xanthobacteraceae bacterium]
MSKSGRKESVEISSGVSSGLGMRIKNVTEFLSHLQKSVPGIATVVELGQSISNDPTNEACRISHQLGKMLSITRARLLASAGRKPLD